MRFWSSLFGVKDAPIPGEVRQIAVSLQALIDFASEADDRIERTRTLNQSDRDQINRLKAELAMLLSKPLPPGWSIAKVKRKIINPALLDVSVGAKIAVNGVIMHVERKQF